MYTNLILVGLIIIAVFVIGYFASIQVNVKEGTINYTAKNPEKEKKEFIVKGINLAVVGDINAHPKIKEILDSNEAKGIDLTYTPYSDENIGIDRLKGHNVILVLQEKIPRGTTQELLNELNNKANIIIVGKAAFWETDDRIVWSTELGEYFPVIGIQGKKAYVPKLDTVHGKLLPSKASSVSPIMEGYSGPEKDWDIYSPVIRPGSDVIAVISTDEGDKPAILYRSNYGAGDCVYFAFNPAEAPAVFLNTLSMLK